MIESGVWTAIEERMRSLGASESTVLAVLSELQWEERSEEIKAVRGDEPYRTLKGTSLSGPTAAQPPAASTCAATP